jgi:cyclopropane fatty-acyl-phospholipid synthase-like methyltransferase
MSLAYRLMYRVGFTPWDNDEVPHELVALVEGDNALSPGRALDLGCGTGTQAVYLARHGWHVTALDVVDRALRRARARGAAAGVEVEWVHHDVGRLSERGLEPGVTMVLDRGCYHGLSKASREGYARGVEAVAAPGTTLLLMSFAPNRKPFGPSGATEAELRDRFGGAWELVEATPATERSPSGPMADVPLTWYRFVRRAP